MILKATGTGLALKILRVSAFSLPQVLILLDMGARLDLLFGFNRTDYGFTTLLFLFVVAPLVALFWLLVEIVVSLLQARRHGRKISFLMPGLALMILVESVIIDIFLLLQAKM